MERNHPVVSHDQWLAARKEFLIKEKEFTRLREELNRQRRNLPWERVEKNYVFEGPEGEETLGQLFAGRAQLIVYHFMFGPDWEAGCPSCSFWADNFNGIDVHLRQRDISFVAISHAALDKLEAYRKRMGWSFRWLSSLNNDFNHEFYVSFTHDEITGGTAYWNYQARKALSTEAVGISVFYRDAAGDIFHTYSCYRRGVDMMNGAYHYMDLTPMGRDEAEYSPNRMAWVRRHDEYPRS